MGLIQQLATQSCERSTGREGCLGEGGYEEDERCNPCRARAELGLSPEAPRRCSSCGRLLVRVDGSGGIWTGTDMDGSQTCPPPLHRPVLFYDEYGR